jgi:pimeloyl-ACP methyl ester carboxylesterase
MRLIARIVIGFFGLVALLFCGLVVLQLFADSEVGHAVKTVDDAELVPTSAGVMQVRVTGPRGASPIVLVHGVLSSLHWFDRITPYLNTHHEVIAIDMIGNGGSDKPTGGYTVENEAKALGEVLNQLQVTHATLVGHSLGGHVVTSLAEQHPDEVDRLVLLDSTSSWQYASLGRAAKLARLPLIGPLLKADIDNVKDTRAFKVGFAPGFDIASGFIDPLQPVVDVREMTYPSFAQTQAMVFAFTEHRTLDLRLAALGKPVLVIFGGKDQAVFGAQTALAAFHAVPTATVKILPESGHSPQVEQPAQTAALILRFIDDGTQSPRQRSAKGTL